MTNDNRPTIGKNTQKQRCAITYKAQQVVTSGEYIELTKCIWYLIIWEFTDSGLPYINKKTTKKTIYIPPYNDTLRRMI